MSRVLLRLSLKHGMHDVTLLGNFELEHPLDHAEDLVSLVISVSAQGGLR